MSEGKKYYMAKLSSYSLGTIILPSDQAILYYDGIVYLSIFGRDAEVRAFVAGFLDNYSLDIYNPVLKTTAYSGRVRGYKYSIMRTQGITSNGQKFAHAIVYAKEMLEKEVLFIMPKNKEKELKRRLWNSLEMRFKNVPIPSFARKAVWEKYKESFKVCDNSDRYFAQYGFDDYNIILKDSISDTDDDVKELIKSCNSKEEAA